MKINSDKDTTVSWNDFRIRINDLQWTKADAKKTKERIDNYFKEVRQIKRKFVLILIRLTSSFLWEKELKHLNCFTRQLAWRMLCPNNWELIFFSFEDRYSLDGL